MVTNGWLSLPLIPLWVADGFDLDDERAKEMLNCALPYTYGHEIAARVVKAPAKKRILKEQGYLAEETV